MRYKGIGNLVDDEVRSHTSCFIIASAEDDVVAEIAAVYGTAGRQRVNAVCSTILISITRAVGIAGVTKPRVAGNIGSRHINSNQGQVVSTIIEEWIGEGEGVPTTCESLVAFKNELCGIGWQPSGGR